MRSVYKRRVLMYHRIICKVVVGLTGYLVGSNHNIRQLQWPVHASYWFSIYSKRTDINFLQALTWNLPTPSQTSKLYLWHGFFPNNSCIFMGVAQLSTNDSFWEWTRMHCMWWNLWKRTTEEGFFMIKAEWGNLIRLLWTSLFCFFIISLSNLLIIIKIVRFYSSPSGCKTQGLFRSRVFCLDLEYLGQSPKKWRVLIGGGNWYPTIGFTPTKTWASSQANFYKW